MKKLIIFLSLLLITTSCTKTKQVETKKVEEISTIEYENKVQLNGEKTDMSDYVLLNDKDNSFIKISLKEMLRLFDEKGTGVVYIGFAECPWCNRAVPVLNKLGKLTNVPIYYVDIRDSNITNEEINLLFKNLDSILEKDKNGEYVFSVPKVLAIKDGIVKKHHTSIVDSYNDYSKELTAQQEEELISIYYNLFENIK